MPLFLFWYIFRDLLKVMVITTLVVVIIVSFGAAIRPLSDGNLGPWALVKFIFLAMPPMLQFALPFSAAFSATMVYHRMTSDNEIAACSSAGISYVQILLPPATLGVLLTIMLSYIANTISPNFWQKMARASSLDVTDLVLRSIDRGVPVETQNMLLYASSARRVPVPEGYDARSAIWLKQLLAVTFDHGQVASTFTADECEFFVRRDDQQHATVISSVVKDPLVFDLSDSGQRVGVRMMDATPPEIVIQDEIDSTPRFMDLSKLRKVLEKPETFYRVANRISALRQWMTQRELFDVINGHLQKTGFVEFSLAGLNEQRQVASTRAVLYGGSLALIPGNSSEWTVLPSDTGGGAGGMCRLLTSQGGQPALQYQSASVRLRPMIKTTSTEPTVTVEFKDVSVLNLQAQSPRPMTFDDREIAGLRLDQPIVADLINKPVGDLLAQARTMGDTTQVNKLEGAIVREITKLDRNVLACLHERTAMSVSCLVMMLLGAIMAVRMGNSLPLTVYFWSFIPAIFGLLLISKGSGMVKDSFDAGETYLTGLSVMWSGNLLMCGLALGFLRSITKN